MLIPKKNDVVFIDRWDSKLTYNGIIGIVVAYTEDKAEIQMKRYYPKGVPSMVFETIHPIKPNEIKVLSPVEVLYKLLEMEYWVT